MVVPDLDEGGNDPDAPVYLDEDGAPLGLEPEQITRDGFYQVFEVAFSAPGMIDKAFAPVAVQPDEKPAARAASDAVYSLLEIYYPQALVPGSETLAHIMAAAPFFVAKMMVVRAILAERRQKPRAVPPGPGPGPEAQPAPAGPGPNPLSWMDAEATA